MGMDTMVPNLVMGRIAGKSRDRTEPSPRRGTEGEKVVSADREFVPAVSGVRENTLSE